MTLASEQFLLLIRHGETQWNADHRLQGVRVDPPLSEIGRSQTRKASENLPAVLTQVGVVFASPMLRARETAGLLASGQAVVSQQAGLEECDYGEWTGLTRDMIDERYPGGLDAWNAGVLERPPGGESARDVGRRAAAGLDAICAKTQHSALPVLVVTHGDVIRALVAFFGGGWPGTPIDQLGGWWFSRTTKSWACVRAVPSIASDVADVPA